MRKITIAVSSIILVAVMFISVSAATLTSTVNFPIIKSGSTGANAVATQYLLNNKGATLTADGKIGTASVNAIKRFQESVGLIPDGIAGPGTFAKLVVTLKSGTVNSGVMAAQYLLKSKFGIELTVNGNFESTTFTAVKTFQSYMNITSDGIIGLTTWKYLLGSPNTKVVTVIKQSDLAISKAKTLLGSTAYDGYCQKFVRISFEAAGITGYASTALEAWNKWGVSTSATNIAKGATVYFMTSSPNGHVGIYTGNGYVIHAVQTVKMETFEEMSRKYSYIGWGYQGGVNPN